VHRVRPALLVLSALIVCGVGRGQVFPVHGHQLFLKCDGSSPGPAAVLIAGGGGTTSVWAKVQPAVARFARVCSYDRAGLGRSSAIDHPQSADEIVDDLAELLEVAEVHPPYVLVGHSIGGIYARKFDEHYDGQVAGMVLIDSSHEEQIWRFAEDEPSALREYPDWRDEAAMSAAGFLPAKEILAWHFSRPLIVIEHGIPREPVWHSMQKDLASRSPQGKLITATGSSHYIQLQQPQIVIRSIRTVLTEAAQGSTAGWQFVPPGE
jgi:pimeloyl-ACP methyl ester carboxylesterase